MWVYDFVTGEYEWEESFWGKMGRKAGKIVNDPTKHYPNKNEGRLLRQIMSSTGLSEEEVRQHKKYRKMLSEAQKSGEERKYNVVEKFYHDLIKKACRETGLAKEHPNTLTALDIIIEEYFKKKIFYKRWFMEQIPAKAVVEKYGKTYKKK